MSNKSKSRVAISDRQNRHFRVGFGKFSDRSEFGRQSRQILSAKSGDRQKSAVGKNRQSAEISENFPDSASQSASTQRCNLIGRQFLHHVQVISIALFIQKRVFLESRKFKADIINLFYRKRSVKLISFFSIIYFYYNQLIKLTN